MTPRNLYRTVVSWVGPCYLVCLMSAGVPTFLAAAVCCVSCSDSKAAARTEVGDAGDAASSEFLPSQLPADFQCDPTLASIRETIFVTSCGWDSCHGANNATWGLELVAKVDDLAKELVGVASVGCSSWTRVVPGDPEHSLLWSKVSQARPGCGPRMPWGVEPLPPPALGCIEQWIQGL
jgi:hypothetical protein